MKVLSIIISVLLLAAILHGQNAKDIPAAPKMTQEKLYAELGQCESSYSLQNEYVQSLIEKIVDQAEEIQKIKASASTEKP